MEEQLERRLAHQHRGLSMRALRYIYHGSMPPKATAALPQERLNHNIDHLRDFMGKLFSDEEEVIANCICMKSAFSLGNV